VLTAVAGSAAAAAGAIRANFPPQSTSRQVEEEEASMLTPLPTSDCLLAREAVSARLDRELSEHEEARLESHLRECAECSAYARDLGAIANVLRTAPLERPELHVTLARRRALPGLRVAATAAAVLAVAAGSTIALEQGLKSRSKPVATTAAPPAALAANSLNEQLFALFRAGQAPDTHPTSRFIFA
jgi:anti-sigma factor RsiW